MKATALLASRFYCPGVGAVEGGKPGAVSLVQTPQSSLLHATTSSRAPAVSQRALLGFPGLRTKPHVQPGWRQTGLVSCSRTCRLDLSHTGQSVLPHTQAREKNQFLTQVPPAVEPRRKVKNGENKKKIKKNLPSSAPRQAGDVGRLCPDLPRQSCQLSCTEPEE